MLNKQFLVVGQPAPPEVILFMDIYNSFEGAIQRYYSLKQLDSYSRVSIYIVELDEASLEIKVSLLATAMVR